MKREEVIITVSKQYAWAEGTLGLERSSCRRATDATPFEDISVIFIGDIVEKAFQAGAAWSDRNPCGDKAKVYRDHRELLGDSLHTTIECPNGMDDIAHHLEGRYIRDFQICKEPLVDTRLPSAWGSVEYRVYGTYADGSHGIVGWCNFTE